MMEEVEKPGHVPKPMQGEQKTKIYAFFSRSKKSKINKKVALWSHDFGSDGSEVPHPPLPVPRAPGLAETRRFVSFFVS
jgi:hypothetical protein